MIGKLKNITFAIARSEMNKGGGGFQHTGGVSVTEGREEGREREGKANVVENAKWSG